MLFAEAQRRFRGQPVSYGVDRLGPFARIGETLARDKTPADALRAAMRKALEVQTA
jgi:hypothetical protein